MEQRLAPVSSFALMRTDHERPCAPSTDTHRLSNEDTASPQAMWETMASPKALQESRVASSINRSKS